LEASEGTHSRYKAVTDRFLEFLGKKADRDLSTLSADAVLRFREKEASARARATANLTLKILKVLFW
jgi:hypothetical protein